MKETDKKYGVFVYEVDNDENGPEKAEYFHQKEAAIAQGKCEALSYGKNYYVEAWERGEDGLWGNCGEPLYKSDDSPYADKKEKKTIWVWCNISNSGGLVDIKASEDSEDLFQHVKEKYEEEITGMKQIFGENIDVFRNGNRFGVIQEVDIV